MNKSYLTILLAVIIVSLLTLIIKGSMDKKSLLTAVPIRQETTSVISSYPSINPSFPVYEPVLFYGNTCPHCKEVRDWMDKKQIDQKITIVQKEVYDNTKNHQELAQAAKSCGMVTDSIGVPFLYAQGKCIIGTTDVINYLAKKAGISPTEDSVGKN